MITIAELGGAILNLARWVAPELLSLWAALAASWPALVVLAVSGPAPAGNRRPPQPPGGG